MKLHSLMQEAGNVGYTSADDPPEDDYPPGIAPAWALGSEANVGVLGWEPGAAVVAEDGGTWG